MSITQYCYVIGTKRGYWEMNLCTGCEFLELIDLKKVIWIVKIYIH